MALEVGEELNEAEMAWPKKAGVGLGLGVGSERIQASEGGNLSRRPVGGFGYRENVLQTPVVTMCGNSPLSRPKEEEKQRRWKGDLPVQEVAECGIGIQQLGFASSSVSTTFNCFRQALAGFEKVSVERLH